MNRLERVLWFLLVAFGKNVMTNNPFLTYTVRIQKISFHANLTGNYTIDRYRDKYYANGYVTIDTDLTEKPIDKLVLGFQRCHPEGFDCEYFQTWNMLNFCDLIKEKNQIWSSWCAAFRPPIVCPLVNHYKMTNGTFDVGPIIRMYPAAVNYYWKITQKFYAGNTFVGMLSIDMSYFGYRKKNQ